jgi:tRNA 2-thiouridine synthesizing protein A
MTNEELQKMDVKVSVDARGTACPGPLLAAKEKIGEIEKGDIMAVISSDEGTKRDIPKWTKKKGHEYLGTIDDSGYFTIYLRK